MIFIIISTFLGCFFFALPFGPFCASIDASVFLYFRLSVFHGSFWLAEPRSKLIFTAHQRRCPHHDHIALREGARGGERGGVKIFLTRDSLRPTLALSKPLTASFQSAIFSLWGPGACWPDRRQFHSRRAENCRRQKWHLNVVNGGLIWNSALLEHNPPLFFFNAWPLGVGVLLVVKLPFTLTHAALQVLFGYGLPNITPPHQNARHPLLTQSKRVQICHFSQHRHPSDPHSEIYWFSKARALSTEQMKKEGVVMVDACVRHAAWCSCLRIEHISHMLLTPTSNEHK